MIGYAIGALAVVWTATALGAYPLDFAYGGTFVAVNMLLGSLLVRLMGRS